MPINITDEFHAATTKGKIASAKEVFLTGDTENLQQIGEKTHQLEESIKSIAATGGASTATAVTFDNTVSGMTAVTAQAAIDELSAKNKSQDTELSKKANVADVTSQIQTEQKRVNTELGKKANTTDVNAKINEEKTRVDGELGKKLAKADIAQELGDSVDKVVSQRATSSNIKGILSILNGSESIEKVVISKGGVINLDTIELSKNGDSLEFFVKTVKTLQGTEGKAFMPYDSNISITLMYYLIGLRDINNTWLEGFNSNNGQYRVPDHNVLLNGGKVKFSIENDSLNLYLDDSLLKTSPLSSPIKVNKIGEIIYKEEKVNWEGEISNLKYCRNGYIKSFIDLNISYNDKVTVYKNTKEGVVTEMENAKTSIGKLDSSMKITETNIAKLQDDATKFVTASIQNIEDKKEITASSIEEGSKLTKTYFTGSSIVTNTGNPYDVYYYIAQEDCRLYLKSQGDSISYFRLLVANGTIDNYTSVNYAKEDFPTEDNAWEVKKGQLIAINCFENVANWVIVEIHTKEKKTISGYEIKELSQLENKVEELTLVDMMKIVPVTKDSFKIETTGKSRKKLIYLYNRRKTYRTIDDKEILCQDVWSQTMIQNSEGRDLIQGNDNFIIAIDGEKSGFTDESKSYHAGPGHGCEVAVFNRFYADGILFDPTQIKDPIMCKSFRQVQWSNVYAVNATLSAANSTGNINNYPKIESGKPVVSAQHYIDFVIYSSNEIKWKNILIVKRDNTVFNNISGGMLQCYATDFSNVSIEDTKASWSHFEVVNNNITHNVINGDDVIQYSPREASSVSMWGDNIFVKQEMKSLDPSRYGKMRIFTPPVYPNRVKSYMMPAIPSITEDYETFSNGYKFELELYRKIEY